MKFVLFVEGYTEKQSLKNFLKRWLDPKLNQPVGIKMVRFDGWQELIKDSPKKAKLHLKTNKVIAVIALLDLYGPTIYPDDRKSADERYDWAKKDLEERVNDSKFRQFFAVHETEAWLFSDPGIFPKEVKKAFPGKVEKPETVNFDEPPSKLLKRLYKEKTKNNYKKVVHGKELFDKLDPNIAYKKCPRLQEMLNEMLELACQAGFDPE